MKFNNIGLSSQLQEGLEMMGFEKATPVQEQAIPIILELTSIMIGSKLL